MLINKKQKKFTIIIIKDERRLCSFKFPMSFLTICLLTIIGISVIILIAVLLHNRNESLNKGELTAKIESRNPPPDTRNNETQVTTTTGNSVIQSYTLSIENFTARFDLSKKIFRYSFLLKNRNSTYSTVSGYIFIVLKSESMGSEHWLAYPQTVLVNGAPQNFRDGEPFSISKQKVITRDISTKFFYDSAAIFVFSNDGNLVLRETFNVKG